ncbi:MarR family winged helix-turn-helix transcriptional regulator [Phyllobacterium sp. K27]
MSKMMPVTYETTIYVHDHCMCLTVQRAARSLARMFDEALRPHDLTNGQFSLLMSLNRPEPPNLSSVASLLAMDRTTLTAALKPMERRGLIKIMVDPNDKRSRLLALTDDGLRLLADVMPIWISTHGDLEQVLTPGEQGRLLNDLRKLL